MDDNNRNSFVILKFIKRRNESKNIECRNSTGLC